VVLAEECLGVYAILDEVREIENGVPPRLVENAVAGFAVLGERTHRRILGWSKSVPQAFVGQALEAGGYTGQLRPFGGSLNFLL
jgi:hypothetical protein